VHISRTAAACEISDLRSFFCEFPTKSQNPPEGAARLVYAARSASVRVVVRPFPARAPAALRGTSRTHMEQRPLQLATRRYNRANVRAAPTVEAAGEATTTD
jgi:hypothetical protein